MDGGTGSNGTLVECRRGGRLVYRFFILDAPSPSSLPAYIRELQKQRVKHLVRVCGPTYRSEIVERAGITVHHWGFDDGAPPPKPVVDNWLALLDSEASNTEPVTIGVHCVAGLGRAPILVAVALVEFGGMEPLEAIGYVRERRRGVINQVQLNWLVNYKTRAQDSGADSLFPCCSLM